jgi:hypothetical protein
MRRLTPRVRLIIVGLVGLGLLMTAIVSVPLLMVMGSTAVSSDSDYTDTTSCGPSVTTGGKTITLDQGQIANAKTIITTGESLQVPNRGLVVAVAAALQESTLQNLTWGDLDSVGLFQQRNAWGSFNARTDPPTAATMFYQGGSGGQPGLVDIRDWAGMTIGEAAQAVQKSAYPNAYDKWGSLASSLVSSVVGNVDLGCNSALTAGLPTGAIGKMLNTALDQLGKPYVWAAVGPDAFDCSGLVVYSWGQAGYRVRVRTAAQMYLNSTPIPRGQERPGDLLFGEFGSGGAGHVMIVVKPGTAVQAPHTGDVVKITDYSSYPSSWVIGRLKPSVLDPVTSSTRA